VRLNDDVSSQIMVALFVKKKLQLSVSQNCQ
jgi:hypothetical protein